MKKGLVLFGFLVLFMGALPYLLEVGFLSFLEVIPSVGLAYQLIIVILGALALFFGFKL